MVVTDQDDTKNRTGILNRLHPHIVPFALGMLLFFGLNLLPVLIQGRSDSLGNNTDSIWHYLKILRLRGELAPHASFDMDVRLPTDARLYAVISTTADAMRIPLIRLLQLLWFTYSMFFVAGCYLLGGRITGNPWGGAFFGASGWGFALAIGGHWGWDFSPMVPHDLATAFVPWLMLLWLRLRSRVALAGYFALLGALAHLYPTTFVHLAGLTIVAHIVVNPKDIRTPALGAVVFLMAILPLALTWGGKGPIPADLMPLVEERLPYLAPGSVGRIISEFKVFFVQLLLSGIAAVLLSGSKEPWAWPRIRAFGWAALLAAILGQITANSSLLAPLFVSRASRFSYVWLLLLQARTLVPRDRGGVRWGGIVICVVSLGLRPNLVGPGLEVLGGENLKEAVNRYHIQDTSAFRELTSWIEGNTGNADPLCTPPDGRYLFLRAYARRPVAILDKDLGCVTHARTPLLHRVWKDVLRAKQAYRDHDLEQVFELAAEWDCRAVVFPPEWRPAGLDPAFSNEAGSVVLLTSGSHPPTRDLRPGYRDAR